MNYNELDLMDFINVSSDNLFEKTKAFSGFLSEMRNQGKEDPYLRTIEETNGAIARTSTGHEVQIFCTANYLGLSRDSRIITASQSALEDFGASVSSVPLIAGATQLHRQLEQDLASFLGMEDVALFPTGYAANIGLISSLCRKRDIVLVDKQVHASILDGVKLSSATLRSFKHSNIEDLKRVLGSCRERCKEGGILVVAEGVYGIDGDVSPVGEIYDQCRLYGAKLLVDDAHGLGVVGEGGRGSVDCLGNKDDLILMGSLSKSLGSMGGFIAGSRHVIDYLRYYARTIVFSVGVPAVSVAAALESLSIIGAPNSIVGELQSKISFFRNLLADRGFENVLRSESAIMSIKVGSNEVLRDATPKLFNQGVWAEGLPFPAVTRGQERIRFRVTNGHTYDGLQEAADVIKKILEKYDLGERSDQKSKITAKPSSTSLEIVQVDARQDISDLIEMAVESAITKGEPITWFDNGHYQQILRGSGDWGDAFESRQLFASYEDGKPIGFLTADLQRLNGKMLGALGHCHWVRGKESSFQSLVGKGLAYLDQQGCVEVVMPYQAPLNYFGGGINISDIGESPPFQPSVSNEIVSYIEELGFSREIDLQYQKISIADLLRSYRAQFQKELPTGFGIRNLNLLNLGEEMKALLPLVNSEFASLPYCTQITAGLFRRMLVEFKDLIVSDLWLILENKGIPIGFIGTLPDVSAVITDAKGEGLTTDLERLGWAADAAETAIITWMYVQPEYAQFEFGSLLFSRILENLHSLNYKDVWLTYELVDGTKVGDSWFSKYATQCKNFPIYKLSRS